MQNQISFSFDVPGVSELTWKIKSLLETNFREVLVEGEISNVKASRNGHVYFTLKDSDAQLPCVMWRSTAQRLQTELRDGQQVVLGGDIQVYAPHGRYQMIVTLVEQAGTGMLQQKFEELKLKLEKEGLFLDANKKPLPPFPLKIGVITSATGAAFHDIRDTFEKRWPVATLYLHHASVQGLNAAGEIANAIQYFSTPANPVDLLIVGRGGGSLEDLWPFNEEIVARAIFNCPIPVVSAVGHEVDFSISDFVADARAATPTQAVILATPDINELRYIVDDYTTALEKTLKQRIQYYKDYTARLAYSHALLAVSDKIKYYQTRTANLTENLFSKTKGNLWRKTARFKDLYFALEQHQPAAKIKQKQSDIEFLAGKLHQHFGKAIQKKSGALKELQFALAGNNPKAPLEKGFTRILQNGEWIRSLSRFSQTDAIEIEWHDGKMSRK